MATTATATVETTKAQDTVNAIINRKADGSEVKKSVDLLKQTMSKDSKEVNELLRRIAGSSESAFNNWLKVSDYIAKWKKMSFSKNEYGQYIDEYCPNLDRRILSYLWKINMYKDQIKVFRREECPTVAHPRTVWTRWYDTITDDAFKAEVIKSTGIERLPSKDKDKTGDKDKAGAKPGKETSKADVTGHEGEKVTSQTLTGALDFAARLKGYSMALNAVIIDANSGNFTDHEKRSLRDHLKAALKALEEN